MKKGSDTVSRVSYKNRIIQISQEMFLLTIAMNDAGPDGASCAAV